ncbi:MAG: M1 family metallopeptidase [Bacteroidales bacterium]|nr:M1 family metallopeptidase [Bacteroidales bacterium]
MRLKWIVFAVILSSALQFSAQQGNSDLFIPREFQRAVKNQTRSLDGKPGQAYFQNRVNYAIEANFNPITAVLDGEEKIEFFNNSRDSLRFIVFRLYQNLLKKDALRQSEIDASDLHDGLEIKSLKVEGVSIDLANLKFAGTNMYLILPSKMAPKTKLDIEVSWQVKLPEKTLIRMGRYDSTSYFVAYWYPQIAVYDDINGWSRDSYTGLQEFYNEYGDFDVKIKVPENFVVWATGELQNRSDIFSTSILQRIEKSEKSDDLVQVITPQDIENQTILKKGVSTVWHFQAKNVSDFAFGTSTHYVWDAQSVVVDSASGRRAVANAVYQIDSKAGEGVASIAARTMQMLSFDIIGVPYPYPHNTVWEGHFGMEFPMMCNDGPADNLFEEVFVTSHEVSHSYFPFLVGSNEILYAWIDEGLITFLPKAVEMAYGNANAHYYIGSYTHYAMGTSMDIPLSVPTTQMNQNTYMMQNYGRAAVGFYFLHDMLGKDLFREVLKEFIHRWEGKHPTPTDLAFTFASVTGKDLSWYWNEWFYKYGFADLALKASVNQSNMLNVSVKKIGSFPVPVKLKIVFEDGSSEVIYNTAEVWQSTTEWTLEQKFSKKIVEVVLGDRNIPDVNNSDNHVKL